jgi:hypothetical protein
MPHVQMLCPVRMSLLEIEFEADDALTSLSLTLSLSHTGIHTHTQKAFTSQRRQSQE